jgi:hypothetical protein
MYRVRTPPLAPSESTSDSDKESTSDSDEEGTSDSDGETLSDPNGPPPHRVLFTNLPPSQTQQEWTPAYKPSWTLGPQHDVYVHTAASYLIAVPGGVAWEQLLARYIIFEGLSSARSVSMFVYRRVATSHH